MIANYFNELKKYKILLITLLTLIAIGFLGVFSFNKIKSYYYDYKFEKALKEAAKIDPSSWDEKYQNMVIKDKYKVVIVSSGGGEYSYAEYFKYAGERMGWEVQIYLDNIFGYEEKILKFDPDFILYLHQITPNKNHLINIHRSKKYIVSLLSLRNMRDFHNLIDKKNPYKLLPNISMINGIITTEKEGDVFRKMFLKQNKPFNGLKILPLVPKNLIEPAEPKSLMWMSSGWDKLRSSSRYKNFIKRLGDDLSMKVYGRFNNTQYLTSSIYDGCIPFAIDISKAIRKHGIYLLTHSDVHIKSATPTLRIFEAVSANAVIISDRHPFIVEQFGDNILYFDNTADSEEMFKQVKVHYEWIIDNPEKAKAMANRAHKIFLDKFTLENDLVRIAKMHEYIVKQEKEMKLSYPLVY